MWWERLKLFASMNRRRDESRWRGYDWLLQPSADVWLALTIGNGSRTSCPRRSENSDSDVGDSASGQVVIVRNAAPCGSLFRSARSSWVIVIVFGTPVSGFENLPVVVRGRLLSGELDVPLPGLGVIQLQTCLAGLGLPATSYGSDDDRRTAKTRLATHETRQ